MRATALAILALIAATPAFGFDINASRAELRKSGGILTIGDLATGEVGVVNYATFCTISGALFQLATDRLAETPSDYAFAYRERRDPGNLLTIEVSAGKSADDTDWRKEVVQRLAEILDCALYQQFGHTDVIAVNTINGQATAQGLLTAQ